MLKKLFLSSVIITNPKEPKAENAFQTLLSIIKVGMTEIETAIIFERIMTEFGADNLAFPT